MNGRVSVSLARAMVSDIWGIHPTTVLHSATSHDDRTVPLPLDHLLP